MWSGDFLCLVESMVRVFHKNLKRKMNIIKKPHLIGHDFKTLCDARSKIVLYMELGKKIMKKKDVKN